MYIRVVSLVFERLKTLSLVPSSPAKIKMLLIIAKNLLKILFRIALLHMKTRTTLKYFVNNCSHQVSALTENFDFWTKSAQKDISDVKAEKLILPLQFYIVNLV